MRSIRRWLFGWLICGLSGACLSAGFGIFKTVRNEAGELFDYELRTVAMSLPRHIDTATDAERPTHDFAGISDDLIVIDIWSDNGEHQFQTRSEPSLPRLDPGFQSISRGDAEWRVFGVQQSDRYVQVAQPYSVREDLALRLAWRTLWPLALLFPATVVLVLLVVARGLAPLSALSRSIAARSAESLEPIDLNVQAPVEILPVIAALDDLLHRLNTASQAQRTFIADAAHELRTPLAALKLQIQSDLSEDSIPGAGPTLVRLESRLNRIIHLAQQLLTLAREDAQQNTALVPTSLRRLAEQSVSDFSLSAEAKGVDLGLEWQASAVAGVQTDDYEVLAEPHSLGVLINNLVDNAIRHTPAGGKVDVMLRRDLDGVALDVLDSGAGVADHELERLFDRFYRGDNALGQGSGLGLAIALRIAERHRATLTLVNRKDTSGLCASVTGLRPVLRTS